jgi:hypothetical protein
MSERKPGAAISSEIVMPPIFRILLEHQDFEACLGEITSASQPVMARADDDRLITACHDAKPSRLARRLGSPLLY